MTELQQKYGCEDAPENIYIVKLRRGGFHSEWSEKHFFDDEIKYVRADLHENLEAEYCRLLLDTMK